jgi:hypothetical protein
MRDLGSGIDNPAAGRTTRGGGMGELAAGTHDLVSRIDDLAARMDHLVGRRNDLAGRGNDLAGRTEQHAAPMIAPSAMYKGPGSALFSTALGRTAREPAVLAPTANSNGCSSAMTSIVIGVKISRAAASLRYGPVRRQ